MRSARLLDIAAYLLTVLASMTLNLSGLNVIHAQVGAPEVLDTATLQEQLDYLRQRTNIYNGYRAVRDDIFLKISQNALDSLNAAKRQISQLHLSLENIRADMVSLEQTLQQTSENRDLAIRNKDSLSFLGIPMKKAFYNTIMWLMVTSLAALLVIIFLLYRRSIAVTRQTRSDLEESREEFENYRQQSRERYEKLVVQHHKEILKLKGPKPRSIE